MMRRFIVYRKNPPENYVEEGYANPVDEIQVEGVVFSDNTCVIRWCTETRSHAIWSSFEDFAKIHGHPEYETEIVWLDENIDLDPYVKMPPISSKTVKVKVVSVEEGKPPYVGECQACKPRCPKCNEILASPGYQSCTCFTCPDCGRRNTEMMFHTCGKEPGYPSLKMETSKICYGKGWR